MNRVLIVGIILALLGALGYAVGLVEPYPGRAFALTAIMIGITFVAIRRVGSPEGAQ